jgi:hypothetical protein
LPLVALAQKIGDRYLPILSVFEWQNPEVQNSLDALFQKEFTSYEGNKVREQIENLIAK